MFILYTLSRQSIDKRRAGLALRYMPTTSHFDRAIPSDGGADFARRPIFLVRGVDRCGKNEFKLAHPGAKPAGTIS